MIWRGKKIPVHSRRDYKATGIIDSACATALPAVWVMQIWCFRTGQAIHAIIKYPLVSPIDILLSSPVHSVECAKISLRPTGKMK